MRPPFPRGPYTLNSGDRLRIVVFGQEGLTNSYAVDASGHIAMPLIGPVLARGATTDQLSSRIGEKLRDGFIREPHVAVEIEAYRPFFILGEVTAPGQYPFVANMSVETAVAIAGGFTPRAFRKTVMLNRTLNGRQVRISVPVTVPAASRRHDHRARTVVLICLITDLDPLLPYFFRCFCRNAIERRQATLAAASL